MALVLQTIFHDPAVPDRMGNCLQAAIASMLDLPLDEVPHFVQIDEDTGGNINWWTHMVAWLRERGWRVDTRVEPGEVYLGGGPSPRGADLHHVAVYRDGELVHDPHPDGTGLVEIRSRWALRPCEPIPMRRHPTLADQIAGGA
jgi:hypothetical protein